MSAGLTQKKQQKENSQSVERSSKAVKTSGQREEGRAESAADQVGGVGTDVSTLVIGVDGQVETHKLDEVLVVGEAELVGEVIRIVLVLLDRGDLAIVVNVAVNARSDGRQLGDEIHGILKGMLPVFGLLHALGVGLGERGLVLKGVDGDGELSHGVKVAGAAVDELLDELGNVGARSPLGGEVADLLFRGNLTGEEEPEES